MRTYAVLLGLLLSLNAFAFGSKNSKEGLWISPESLGESIHEVGDQVNFKGKICVYKKHIVHKFKKHTCHKLREHHSFKSYKLRFFFPDSATEVTDQVTLNELNDGIEYNYQSSPLVKDQKHQLLVTVEEENKIKDHLLEINAKMVANMQALKDKFEEKKLRMSKKHQKHLERKIALIEKIIIRIKRKRFINPHMFAELRQPVALKNDVSLPYYFSTLFGGMRMSLEAQNGNPFNGEKNRIHAEITNVNYVEDPDMIDSKYKKYQWQYRMELYDNENLVFTSDKSTLNKLDKIEYDYESSALSFSDPSKYNLRLVRSKDIKLPPMFSWMFDQQWGMIEIKPDVIEDNSAPVFKNSPQMVYVQNFPSIVEEITDSLGRIKRESIIARQVGETLSGEMIDLPGNVDIVAINPEIDNHSNHYLLNIAQSSNEEGLYQLMIQAQDSSSNYALPNPQIYEMRIDRTKPVLSINVEDNQLTNNPSFDLPIQIEDHSPVSVKVYRNGELVGESSETSFTQNITLQEENNKIEVKVVDAAGNEAVPFVLNNIHLDTIPPVLSNVRPDGGEILRSLEYNVVGNSNEALSKVSIDGIEKVYEQGSTSFSIAMSKQAEGEFQSEVRAYDLAGNEAIKFIDFKIVLKLIRIELITLMPENGKVKIIGQPGAARPNLEIEIDGGFFNDQDVVSNEDGSFEASLNYSSVYNISADDPELNRSESYSLEFNADTTFTGIVKNTDDTPIPGVTVTIVSSGQSSVTDGNGVFAISEPSTGDQKVVIDGTTVPEEYTNGEIAYSSQTIQVVLGNLQRNALDRPIYMALTYLDGEDIDPTLDTVVTSVHAPGVSLEIPAESIQFPSGVTHSKVSIAEIPADKTSIEVLEFSKPDTVYALEPSGVKFSKQVKLTLPNPNGFSVGQELVILSKNSETGQWEVDGAARVTTSDTIETLEGQGITHFSEVYATPYGLKVEPYEPKNKPGIFNDTGGLSKNISLPTYKVMGQDFGVNLVYNSLWANPNVLVTNTFNIVNEKVRRVYKDHTVGGNDFHKVKLDGFVESWTRPDYLKSKFTAGSVETKWFDFDAENAVDEAVVSYSVDLDELETAPYPAIAEYRMRYKTVTVQRLRKRTERTFGGTFTRYINDTNTKLYDEIFPPALRTNLYVQNKIDSEVGQGWKIGNIQKIANPGEDRLLLEEASGKVSPYVLKNSVETILAGGNEKISSLNIFNDQIFLAQGKDIKEYSLDGEELSNNTTPVENVIITSRQERYLSRSSKWFKPPYCGTKFYGYGPVQPSPFGCFGGDTYTTECLVREYTQDRKRNYVGVVPLDNDSYLLADSMGWISSFDGTENPRLAGKKGNRTAYTVNNRHLELDNDPGKNAYCAKYSLTGICNNKTYHWAYVRFSEHSASHKYPARCYRSSQWNRASRGLPLVGKANGDALSSTFNNIQGMIASNQPGVFLVVDTGNNKIRRFNTLTNTISDFAGNGQTYDNGDGGTASQASMFHPRAIVKDNFGNYYISTENGFVRKINPQGMITTIAGGDNYAFEGSMNTIEMRNPSGLAIDNERGLLYVADTGFNRILQLDLISGYARTVVGTGQCDLNDIKDGKAALNTNACQPKRIALDLSGNLYYLDNGSNRIRKVLLHNDQENFERYVPTSPDGSELIKLADGNIERHFRDGSIIKFDNQGLHRQSITRLGVTTNFQYDGDKLTQIIDPKGGITTLNYIDGRLRTILDPAGRTTDIFYNGNQLASVQYDDGTVESFEYSSRGLMTISRDKRNYPTTYKYNAWYKLEEVLRADGNNTLFSDALSESYVDGTNSETNKKELKNRSESPLVDIYTNANGVETELLKDESGVVTTIFYGEDKAKSSTIERDLDGRPVKIIKHTGEESSFIYSANLDSDGLLKCIDAVNDNQACYDYVVGDLLEKYDSASSEKEVYSYNKYGNLLTKQRYLGSELVEQVLNEYDENGNLYKQTDLNGLSSYKTFRDDGLVKTSANHLSETVTFEYDEYGNLTSKINDAGDTTRYVRDIAGNIIQKTNARGDITLYTYDVWNRLTSVATGVTDTDPVGKITAYTYDQMGNLLTITDPKGNTTSFEYNSVGRLIKKTTSLDQVTELKYDGNGNVTWEKDPNGNIKTFAYDDEDQLIAKVLPDNSYAMDYDENGNMISISDSDSSIDFDYIKANNDYLVSKVTSNSSYLSEKVLEYTYDSKGMRATMETPYGQFSYGYDEGGRLTNLNDHNGDDFTFTYDNANRLSKITRPGSKTEFWFDNTSFLYGLKHTANNSTIIGNINYTRDGIGNRTSMTTTRGTYSYGYDEESQLKTVGSTEVGDESFSYDDLGNRTNDQLGSYSYDQKSQRLMSDYRYNYMYDNNGNLIQKSSVSDLNDFIQYSYSSENQLVKVEEFQDGISVKEIDYKYDALGRRIAKIINNGQTNVWTYDGQEILAEYIDNDLAAVYTQSTLRTDDTLAADIKSTKLTSIPGKYFYQKDGLGSITEITDRNGQLIQHYAYSSFGKISRIVDKNNTDVTANPPVKTAYSFTNREWDQDAGMYYYRARFYDPGIGRFIQEDPHPGATRIPITIHSKFIYALNNPVNLTDPDGKFVFSTILIISLVSSALTTAISGGNFSDFLVSFVLNVAVMSGAAVFAAGGFAGAFVGAGAGGAALSVSTAVGIGMFSAVKSLALSTAIETAHRNLGERERELFNVVAGISLFVYGVSDGKGGKTNFQLEAEDMTKIPKQFDAKD
jgi:RHS repeat-associated protein